MSLPRAPGSRNRLRSAVVVLIVGMPVLTALLPRGAAGASSGDDGVARVANSGQALAKARTARFQATTKADTGGNASKVTFAGSSDFARRASEYTVDAAHIGLGGGGKVHVRFIRGIEYLSLDALQGGEASTTPQLAGKKWLRLNPSDFGGDTQIGQSDPNAGLDALRGATGDVRKVGRETVRGASTTHYRTKLDLDQAVSNAPADQRTEVSGTVRALGSGTVPADVWVDGKGRVRKIRLRVGTASAGNQGSLVFEYFDLGSRVSVEEPPASEVVDFADILGGSTPPAS
jgi:hypothetical protein